jgi:hypothetical protein
MSKKKTYEHQKINLLKNLEAVTNVEKVIELVKDDKVEEALKEWDKGHHAMHFSLSENLAKSEIGWMRNNLIDLIDSKK